MTVVFKFDRCINAADCLKSFIFAGAGNLDRKDLAGFQPFGDAFYRIKLFASQLERSGILSLEKLERQNAHSDQVAAMDPFVTFRDHGPDP